MAGHRDAAEPDPGAPQQYDPSEMAYEAELTAYAVDVAMSSVFRIRHGITCDDYRDKENAGHTMEISTDFWERTLRKRTKELRRLAREWRDEPDLVRVGRLPRSG